MTRRSYRGRYSRGTPMYWPQRPTTRHPDGRKYGAGVSVHLSLEVSYTVFQPSLCVLEGKESSREFLRSQLTRAGSVGRASRAPHTTTLHTGVPNQCLLSTAFTIAPTRTPGTPLMIFMEVKVVGGSYPKEDTRSTVRTHALRHSPQQSLLSRTAGRR